MDVQVKNIMTPNVITAKEGMTLKQAIHLLHDYKVKGMPVVDENYKIIGIITESDIVEYSRKIHVTSTLDTKGWVSPYEITWDKNNYQRGADLLEKTAVEKIMSKKAISVKEETSVLEVAKIMKSKKINRVPIVDENNKLLGIVTRSDIINFLAIT